VRLATAAALAVALTFALVGWLVSKTLETERERYLDASLDRLAARAGEWLDRETAAVGQALAAVETELRGPRSGTLRLWLTGAPDPDGTAGLESAHDLDLLEVLDDEGRVLAGAPSRVGLVDPGATRRGGVAAAPHPARVSGAPPLLLARRELRVGSHLLHLIGARRLDERRLDRLAGIDAVLWVPAGGGGARFGGRGAEIDVRALTATTAARSEVDGIEGGRWRATGLPLLGADGSELGTLFVALDAGPAVAGVHRGLLLGLGAGATLVAALAGAWVGGRLSRPVDELLRAVDAVAAGEADYTFAGAGRGETGRVAAAFSRLKRSYELQRRRSAAAERIAGWRDVARRIAHEVKNPLAPIRLTAQNLVRARERDHERFDALFRDGMRTIQEEVEQLARLVDAFSEFARLPTPRPRRIDPAEAIERALELYAADPRWEVRRSIAPGLAAIEADPDQLSRALKNVLLNALEAMPDGGALDVRARMDGESVEIEIADRGPGFTGDAERRLFEPYFTSKPSGTGLGMAITYRIVVEHGGEIRAENRAGGGARVLLRFPGRPPGSDGNGRDGGNDGSEPGGVGDAERAGTDGA
jgi:signal transduction histidine kinase